jgi:lipid II:glycine glycyltransferase (peptidoglycan interpeptide bridge formation enzyme)
MNDCLKTVLTQVLSEEDRDAFDEAVGAGPFPAYQQTRAWAENAPRSARHDFLYFLCRDGEETIGAAVVRRTRLAPGAALATVQRGPIVLDPQRLETVLAQLKSALRASGFSTVVANPRIANDMRHEAAQALARCGFQTLPASSQSLHTATGIIPLYPTEEEIFARLKQRGRRSIRKVETKGVTVREAVEADLAACRKLRAEFHARRPGYEAAGQPDIDAQARLIAAEGGAMLVAEADGRLVGCHSFLRQGQRAIWLGMAIEDDPQTPRSYLLVWEALRHARALGLTHYDLAGLSEEGEATGRDQFKQAFAPEREELLPAYVAALRPLRHALFFNLRQLYRARRKP